MLPHFIRFRWSCTAVAVAVSLLVSGQGSFAQGVGTISGQVTDKETGNPLAYANVAVMNTGLGTATDFDGKFIIRSMPLGPHTLRVSYIGYEPVTLEVMVSEGDVLDRNFALVAQTVVGETVIITAQAQGQNAAINQQINSNTISNIVSAARIKELPDVNAAESIGRLPGVSIERSGGEATKVAIRGLLPKYNVITVNGVTVPATGGEDRSVDLSLISSNVIDGIEVKKANTPDMDGDVLGGSVDLKLKEADAEPTTNLMTQWGYNHLHKYYGNYNLNGSASSRYLDGNLGVIVTFNADNYNRSVDRFTANYFEQPDPVDVRFAAINLEEQTVTRGRTGASALFDYIIPNGKITVNGFYNRLQWDQLNRINRMSLGEAPTNRHYYNFQDRGGVTSIFTGAASLEKDLGLFSIDVSLARTASRMNAPGEQTWHFVQEAGAFSEYDLPAGTDPRMIVDTSNMTVDTTRTFLSEVNVWNTDRSENQTTVQFNAKLPFTFEGVLTGYVKAGAKFRWLDRMNDVENHGRTGIHYGAGGNEMETILDQNMPAWGIQVLVDEYGHIPVSLFLDAYARKNFLDNEYPLGFTVRKNMLERVTQVLANNDFIKRRSVGSIGDDYDGIERYQAAYVMGELNLTEYVTLLGGVRYEADYSKYHGQRFKESTVGGTEEGPPVQLEFLETTRRNDFLLPMVHLILKPNDWLKLRLARTETLTRPDFIQYAPITRMNSFNTYGRAANTDLKPAHSTNYDVALSVYENAIGLFSVSAFRKSIDDLIIQTRYTLFAGVPVLPGWNIPDNWYPPVVTSSPDLDTYINNPFPATYEGFEIEWQTHFWYLPSVFKGLVLNVNYTRIFSETNIRTYADSQVVTGVPPRFTITHFMIPNSRSARMPGQPAHILNITLGYDLEGFSTRLSYLYQTNRVASIDNLYPSLDSFSGEYSRWDLSIQQRLGFGLQVFANLTNLTNVRERNYRGDESNPTSIEAYGFTLDVGVRYSLF